MNLVIPLLLLLTKGITFLIESHEFVIEGMETINVPVICLNVDIGIVAEERNCFSFELATTIINGIEFLPGDRELRFGVPSNYIEEI